MKPNQYHRLLGALDEALAAFKDYAADLTEDDLRLQRELEVMRSQILKAESGHPFPFKQRLLFEDDSDFDMTRTPWVQE